MQQVQQAQPMLQEQPVKRFLPRFPLWLLALTNFARKFQANACFLFLSLQNFILNCCNPSKC